MTDRPPIARAIAILESVHDADDLAWLRRGFALAGPVSRMVALLSPFDVTVADEQRVVLTLSSAAMIEQATDPSGNTTSPAAASKSYTSMFQSESTAIKAVREISWLGRTGCAAYFTCAY